MVGFLIVNAALAVFNMLPIPPPLDGSGSPSLVLPPADRHIYTRISQYGFLILIALVFVFDGALSFLGSWIGWVIRVVV